VQQCVRKAVGDSLNMNVRDSTITTPGVTASSPAYTDSVNKFTVTEFGVNHVSMPNALGYLINLNGTKIVYSGDTIKVQVCCD
jgi:mRNA degradation ribonuclease J1/J2